MFLYKSAVTKHGSHNQKTHAGSRGKGGAGSSGGSSKPSTASGEVNRKEIDSMVSLINDSKKDIGAGFADARNNGFQVRELQNLRDGTKSLDRAQANLKRLKNAKTPNEKSKIADKAITDLDNAIEYIDSGDARNSSIETAVADLYDIREMAIDIMNENS